MLCEVQELPRYMCKLEWLQLLHLQMLLLFGLLTTITAASLNSWLSLIRLPCRNSAPHALFMKT